MTSLRELQRALANGVLLDDTQGICAAIAGNGLAPQRRIAIYRNNAREGFVSTLQAAFPVVLRLAGEPWFRQTATEYWRAHPSRSGNLHFVGESLAGWLEEHLSGSPHAYFADVARLEWAYQEVLVAAEACAFDAARLATVAPDRYPALRFDVHPASRLVASNYPVLEIWKRNQAGVESTDTLSLEAGPSRVLVIRRDDHVELRELPAGDFALLRALGSGKQLAEAADVALDADAELDLGASLTRIVRLGVLVDFSCVGQTQALSLATAPDEMRAAH